eukprot:CAMPEP_0171094174 /NCGR_PEP_ID=MMETSP0766_2-20121228/40177_1 /TAXON_ID=439317 /ORGANISM="Gambierdiscus australes, Strain CAWD 149" /LENGTH=160 /DNA_ID=CAMNT_0011552751 /DNA_START=67 /DNA_END=549 /DNA_ORIENTATION=+
MSLPLRWLPFLSFVVGLGTALVFRVDPELGDVVGAYADPNHPGHLRHIAIDGDGGIIWSSDDGITFWKVPIKIEQGSALEADFSLKGGPQNLSGSVIEAGIQWADGNVWERVDAKGMENNHCKVLCQRFGFKALGKAFANIKMPQPCVPKCDEVYPTSIP